MVDRVVPVFAGWLSGGDEEQRRLGLMKRLCGGKKVPGGSIDSGWLGLSSRASGELMDVGPMQEVAGYAGRVRLWP